MTDEELCKGLRLMCFIPTTQAADRIEALTEQLEAARADAKEAEAYAEELEKERDEWKSLAEAAIKDDASKNIYYAELKAKLATCEKYRDAYDKMGRIGTEAYRDLEIKLAECEARLGKAVEAAVDAGASLAAAISLLERGGRKAAPSNKMFDQMLVDYRNSLERTRATLAEIEGEKK